MRKSILCLLLLLSIAGLQAQSIHKTWQILTISDIPMPDGMIIIMQFTEEGELNMFSPSGNATTEYKLSDDNKTLEIKGEENDEIWEIVTLTENELVINDPLNGEFRMQETDIDPNTLVEPLIEGPEEEPRPEYSIDSDFKPSKKDAKLIQGYWVAKSFNGVDLPSEIGIAIEFGKSDKIYMYINGAFDEDESATYKLVGQKLEIDSERGDELWGIKSLGKDEMILLDKSVGEIKLTKTKKPKEEKKVVED